MYDPDGTIAGQLHPVFEETQKVVNERRLNVMRDLARLSSTRTLPDFWSVARDILSQLDLDLPHAAAYTLEDGPLTPPLRSATTMSFPEKKVYVLQETIGCDPGCALAPKMITVIQDNAGLIETNNGPWPLAQVCATREIVIVDNIGPLLRDVPARGITHLRPTRAAVLPLLRSDRVVGCLVVCLNPALPYNADFQRFLEVLARQISASAVVMWSYESEVHKCVSIHERYIAIISRSHLQKPGMDIS